MSLKIVTGGTTDAADGTLVSSGNKLTIATLNTPIDAHVRADDDTWTQDVDVTLPAELELSYNGGSTWKGIADNPVRIATGVGLGSSDVGDLNYPIKLRQIIAASSSAGTFTTDATFTACTALSDVTSFTVTPGNTQNAVSWGAVTNRTRYQVDRATNSGFTTGVTLGVYTGTGTSFTDTGLTNGTTYYYRIKAVGTYRYKDSANFATANGAPVAPTVRAAVLALSPLVYYELTETSGTAIADQGSLNVAAATQGGPTLNQTGPKGTDKAVLFSGAQAIKANATSDGLLFTPTSSFTVAMWVKLTSAAQTAGLMSYMLSSPDYYGWDYEYLSSGKVYRFRGRAPSSPNYYDNQFTQSFTAGTWYHVAFVCNGTDVKYYRNGTLADTWTPASMTMSSPTGSGRRLIIGGTDLTLLCNAAIAHPCVFGSALTQPQIQTMVDGA